MEATHILKYIHTSPRKLRLVADMVRKMSPDKALSVLEFTPKMAARDMSNAIKTVLANARNRGMAGELFFDSLEVNESLKMRRFMAGTRGRVKPFKRRMGHIKIVLSDNLKLKTQKSKVKAEDEKPKKVEVKSKKLEKVEKLEEIKEKK